MTKAHAKMKRDTDTGAENEVDESSSESEDDDGREYSAEEDDSVEEVVRRGADDYDLNDDFVDDSELVLRKDHQKTVKSGTRLFSCMQTHRAQTHAPPPCMTL